MIDRSYIAAKNSGIGFNVATIPASFSAPSRGAFDPDYMKALFRRRLQPRQEHDAVRCANRRPIRASPPSNRTTRQTSIERSKTGSGQMRKFGGFVTAIAIAALLASVVATPSVAAGNAREIARL